MSIASVQSSSRTPLEDPPQWSDALGADGELDIGEQSGPGQLAGEVAGVRAQQDPPGPRPRR
jgi:hypothetical protein